MARGEPDLEELKGVGVAPGVDVQSELIEEGFEQAMRADGRGRGEVRDEPRQQADTEPVAQREARQTVDTLQQYRQRDPLGLTFRLRA